MAKCGKEEEEVLEAWDQFHQQFPEGLIPKEDFLASKKVNFIPKEDFLASKKVNFIPKQDFLALKKGQF